MLTDFQETTADASSLGRIMSSRGRKNLPVGSLIFSSAEAPAIRDKCCLDRRVSHFAATHFFRGWHMATFRCDASTRSVLEA
jgi:hypothetical protein